jgi:outer membrane protein
MPVRVGDNVMRGRKRPAIRVTACAPACAVFALSLSAVRAADLTSPAPTPAPAPVLPDLSGWYVRVGAVGTFPQSSSNLYSQALGAVSVPGGFIPVGVGPEVEIPGRGATYSNVFTVGFEGGYFFTPNWSVEVETGFPVWASVKVNGYAPAGSPPAGTDLGGLMAGGIPITGVYHFTQFGGFQPYLGAGIAPTFALAVRDGYATGGSYQPAVGVVVQGGFDYMFNQHWGVFVDAKQGFVGTTGNSTGINLGPPLGIVSVAGMIKTNARPVSFMTGLVYRF